MIIKKAETGDIPYIAHAGREFMQESNWLGPLTLSTDNIYKTLMHMVNDPDSIVIVAYDDDVNVAGFTFWGLENPWTVEKIGIEILFYVRPQCRQGNIAKAMLDFALNVCQDMGAVMLYSSSTAGFDDDGRTARAYNALLRRRGFKELPSSSFLVKELHNGQS
jgi:GNAT superfamily N-acetyltransferase